MRPTTSAVLFALAVTLAGPPARAASEPKVVTGFAHPESVLIDRERRFVSNIGAKLDPLGHDGDGFVSELAADGRIVALHALPIDGDRLDGPKGMAMLGDRLYVADIDRIVGFDLSTRRQVFEAKVPAGGPTLLNDVAATNDALVVFDTLRGVVWRVDPSTGAFTTIADGIPGANGIVWDGPGQRIVVVGLGAEFEGGDLFEIPAGGPARKIENGPHGILDGLALRPDGSMVVSDWRTIDPPTAGALLRLAPDGSTIRTLDVGRPIHGPADFAVDVSKNEIWIPATLDGAVVIAPLER
jgi:hypothetical protein